MIRIKHSGKYEGRTRSLSTTRDGDAQDTTRWTYDVAKGLVTGKTYADGSEDAFTYTSENLLQSVTNPDGSSYGYEYGECRDLERIVSADPSCRYVFANDGRGRMTFASNTVWSISSSYDERGRVSEESVSVAGETRQLCRDYDAYGRLSRTAVSDASDVDVIYDDRGRIAALSNGEFRVDYRYVGDTIDTGCDLGLSNGAVFSRRLARNPYAPDEIVAVSNIVNGVASVLAYGYDSLHRPIARNADCFAYNLRGEVAAATVAGRSETHVYDFIGNEFASNCLNQPEYASSGVSVWHDANGRAIVHYVDAAMPALYLTYDAMHRLASASLLAEPYTLVQSNVYDNVGRRVMKYASDGVHRYYYDDWLLRLETISTADGLVTIEYVWGKDFSGSIGGAAGIGGLLYTKINGAIYVPQYDAYGNIISYCDAAGNIAASYTYDAFGRTISQSGALADVFAFRYSTKYFDRETGFNYYGKRYYSPALRRWLTRDPIGESGGVNLYEYCGNAATFSMDKIGNARMITGALIAKKNTKRINFPGYNKARSIIRLIEELNRMEVDGKKKYDAKICDFVTTPIEDIKNEIETNGDNVYLIAHGGLLVNGKNFNNTDYVWNNNDKVVEFLSPNGDFKHVVEIESLGQNLNMQNVYGCYLSPRVRKIKRGRLFPKYISSKDDYSEMYSALLNRLMRYRKAKGKCKTVIRIYEGENANEADVIEFSTDNVLDQWPVQGEENYK